MKDNKKTLIFSIVGTFLTIVLVSVGVTYSFFSSQIQGNETSSTIVVEAGTMIISVDGGASFNADNIMPDSVNPWVTKQITITGNNNTDRQMPYAMKIIVDNNTFTTTPMKYTLTGTNPNNNGSTIPNVTNQTNIVSNAELGTGYFNEANADNHIYELKIFFIETNTDQSNDMGKKFAAHIEIVGKQAR